MANNLDKKKPQQCTDITVRRNTPAVKPKVEFLKKEAKLGDYIMIVRVFCTDKCKVGDIFHVGEFKREEYGHDKNKYGWVYINEKDFVVRSQYVVLKNHIPVSK